MAQYRPRLPEGEDYTMLMLIAGLILFLGLHSIGIVAPHWRKRMLLHAGEGAWKGTLGVLNLLGFILIVVGFVHSRHSPVLLYLPPTWLRHVTFLLMLPVFPLLLAAYLPGTIRARSKHPMLLAVKLWATAHLLANGMLADVLLFGSFLLWAIIDRISLKRREPEAIRNTAPSRYYDVLAVVLGLALYAVFLYKLHALLFGVSPLA
jgi:uncharacterized membrane protein